MQKCPRKDELSCLKWHHTEVVKPGFEPGRSGLRDLNTRLCLSKWNWRATSDGRSRSCLPLCYSVYLLVLFTALSIVFVVNNLWPIILSHLLCLFQKHPFAVSISAQPFIEALAFLSLLGRSCWSFSLRQACQHMECQQSLPGAQFWTMIHLRNQGTRSHSLNESGIPPAKLLKLIVSSETLQGPFWLLSDSGVVTWRHVTPRLASLRPLAAARLLQGGRCDFLLVLRDSAYERMIAFLLKRVGIFPRYGGFVWVVM